MRRLFLVGGFLLISFCVFSQNRLGLTSGDYAGVNGVQLNPASGINSYYYLDIQLGGGGVFALNNYLFLRTEDYSVGGLLSKNPEFPTFTNEFGDSRYLDLRQNQKLKSGYSNQQVMGPSVMRSCLRWAEIHLLFLPGFARWCGLRISLMMWQEISMRGGIILLFIM
jgi:hypothetical protein